MCYQFFTFKICPDSNLLKINKLFKCLISAIIQRIGRPHFEKLVGLKSLISFSKSFLMHLMSFIKDRKLKKMFMSNLNSHVNCDTLYMDHATCRAMNEHGNSLRLQDRLCTWYFYDASRGRGAGTKFKPREITYGVSWNTDCHL